MEPKRIWKAQIPCSQPIIAMEIRPNQWITVGGIYRLKQLITHNPEEIEEFSRIFGPFSLDLGACVYEGDMHLNKKAMMYIDFIVSYEQAKDSLPESLK